MYSQSKSSKFDLKPWVVGFICVLITGISYGFGMYLFPMIIPEMAKDLHLDYTQIGTITGIGQASVFLSIPLAGFLTTRIGGLKLIVGIQFIGAVLLAGLYAVNGFKSLLLLNFFIRAWPIMTWIPLISVAIDHIPIKWRATMLTLASSSGCFLVLVDGLLASFFLEHLHWRTLWLTVALICLFSSIFSRMGLKYVGVWQRTGLARLKKEKPSGKELKVWLRSSNGIILNLIFFITGLSFVTFQVYLAPYLRDELGVGLGATGLMWSTMGISGAIGGVLFGLLTDRLGVRISQSLIFVSGLGATGFLFLSASFSSLLVMGFLFGISQAAVYGMGPAYISKILSAGSAAKVFTMGTMIMSSGALLGNFLGGWSKGITDTFWWIYMTVGILFACGALLSLLLIPENKYLRDTSIL
ncbi:MAG: MFS transporter [Deltaproteobacteria bacterium]|uniref:MFS transporter n=1 Tax=Desulfobacula sp. TaxID=2593537 RepID=UPI0019A6B1A0|nr:MFS transporter [Candidatus Desulfobacula maris]MBL6992923.1 MFS transporter [Desulfobacula sp.]